MIPPGKTIGIPGGGQLGRMLAQAATRLDCRVHIYAPRTGRPAARGAFHRDLARGGQGARGRPKNLGAAAGLAGRQTEESVVAGIVAHGVPAERAGG